MTTRPELRMVEPPTMEIQLIRPPPREAPRPRTPSPPPRSEVPLHLHVPAGQPPAEAAGLAPPSTAFAAKPLDPRRMTDQELTAGPRPDLAKIYADEARQPLTRNGVPTDGCKPSWEHSDRIAPPCPIREAGPLPRDLSAQLPNRSDMAAEAAHKNAMKTYHEAPGGAGYPGIACAILHRCKP
ncbi:hypothetical protein [Phenylobacterium sp.]|uniref:hypothetical protein n=1 Tax=Phenylobacterium sp. TaxID=1871053 RepID=UPI001221C9AC|nr:hypothetical protein [Phenylobacterium sp.]THD73198.1 MAG: hypothetical protein E8A12_00125 [Phenylobacterium sp.]